MEMTHWGVAGWHWAGSQETTSHVTDKPLFLSASRFPHLRNEGLPSVMARVGLLAPTAPVYQEGLNRDGHHGHPGERGAWRGAPSLSSSNSTSSLPALPGCPIWQPLTELPLCLHLSNPGGTSGMKSVKRGCFFHIFLVAANGCLGMKCWKSWLEVSFEILKISRVHWRIVS